MKFLFFMFSFAKRNPPKIMKDKWSVVSMQTIPQYFWNAWENTVIYYLIVFHLGHFWKIPFGHYKSAPIGWFMSCTFHRYKMKFQYVFGLIREYIRPQSGIPIFKILHLIKGKILGKKLHKCFQIEATSYSEPAASLIIRLELKDVEKLNISKSRGKLSWPNFSPLVCIHCSSLSLTYDPCD